MSLLKNSIWNLSGYIIPSIIAIPSLGFLARELGSEKFGLLSLSMAIVGYASVFDAGLTRAVIREISINRKNDEEKRKIIACSSVLLMFLGVVGGAIIFYGASKITVFLNVKENLFVETKQAISIIALSLPLFLLNQVWLAILEGHEEFSTLNIIRSCNSSLIAGLPAIFSYYNPSLMSAIFGLVAARFLSLMVTFYSCRYLIVSSGFHANKNTIIRLIKYGSWITVSNIVSPFMAYLDRFVLSSVLGAAYVGYYTAPSEGISRLSIVPNALSRAIFPRLSALQCAEDKGKQRKTAYILMLLACLPIFLCGVLFSEFIMVTWMGDDFSGLSSDILKILLFGFLFNAMAQIPFANIQASGKSKVTAIIHLCEVVPFLFSLYFSIKYWGAIGAAITWSARMVLDCLTLIIVNKKLNIK